MNARTVQSAALQPIVYTQPIVLVKARGSEVVRYEALARFDVAGTICAPGQILEEMKMAGLHSRLDRAMVLAVVLELAQRQSRPSEAMPIHVNVSQETLADTGFAEYVAHVLRFNHVPAHRLVIEIIEGKSFWKNDNIMRTLTLLEQGGVGVAIDDFPNYAEPAELLYCLRFEYVRARIVKLDWSFVQRALGHSATEAAHELRYYAWHMKKRGITLIAEGVETPAMRRALQEIGVTHMQGYLFGRPQPALGNRSVPSTVSTVRRSSVERHVA